MNFTKPTNKKKKIVIGPAPFHSSSTQSNSDGYSKLIANNDNRTSEALQSLRPGLTTSTGTNG
jgi:hypothetical protein